MTDRRALLKWLASTPLLSLGWPAFSSTNFDRVIQKTIPSSGELLPAIGMGSYQTFNVAPDSSDRIALSEILKIFFSQHGTLIDSSPMYGRSESVIGDLVSDLSPKPKVFAASKVWTFGKQAGIEAIEETQRRMRVETMDLMQVHNLQDWQAHIPTLQEMKANKQLRYLGITTSRLDQYEQFEEVMKQEKLDFIQLNYNIKVREAEKRLLPMAIDKGCAVIVNMPFEKGRLFKLVKDIALPEWSKEFDCSSWAQFFLKFIISHPAVTCTIPATSKSKHMIDNMQAIYGKLPDKALRNKMISFFDQL